MDGYLLSRAVYNGEEDVDRVKAGSGYGEEYIGDFVDRDR
jgi:hypothetical protein